MPGTIYNEDCNVGLDRIPDGSIDLVMMDPPYDIQPHHGGGGIRTSKSCILRGDRTLLGRYRHADIRENNGQMQTHQRIRLV